ncbi:MAG: hypothetical protein KAJ12_04975, partial [Bacteroidetes bacterium]|nr:hypothetical protein [Bacteroidota bacterium]
TARYYTPSGRCIQVVDYLNQDRLGVFKIPEDSVRREFTTVGGRPVYEHGGIQPDSVVAYTDYGPMVQEMNRKSMFFKFVNNYLARHKGDTIDTVSPEMLEAFMNYLDEEEFSYHEKGEEKIQDLLAIAESAHYSEELVREIKGLKVTLEKEKDRVPERYQDHIVSGLHIELMSRLKGEKGRIEASFDGDPQLRAAVGLLRDQALYREKLGG